jgi:hypothetical protein
MKMEKPNTTPEQTTQKAYLIGRSTTTLFDFNFNPPAPVFEHLPEEGLFYCVSSKLIPQGPDARSVVTVLDREIVERYAAEFKSHVQALQAPLCTEALAAGVRAEEQERLQRETMYRAENPDAAELTDFVVGAFRKAFNAAPTSSDRSNFEWQVQRKIQEILEGPINEFPRGNPYLNAVLQREGGLDGGNTDDFKVDTGLPSYGYLVPRLLFDLFLARETGLELVTNSTTERDRANATALLARIESHDLPGYLAFKPTYD